MKAVLFAGQGAQRKGMGGALFERYPDVTERASEVLGYSIQELCLSDPSGQLNQTQFTQPALYVVNYLNFLKHISERSIKVDYLAGHSLGEYNALVAAGAFDFETGLKLVVKRGEIMSEAKGGGMAAILGMDSAEVARLLSENELVSIDVANYNTPSQTVVSGDIAGLERLSGLVDSRGGRYVQLKTSAAFHSRYMREPQQKFETYLRGFSFSQPRIPVISNVSAQPYAVDSVADSLSAQVSSSVSWLQSIEYLLDRGVTEFCEYETKLLTRMVNDIRKGHKGKVGGSSNVRPIMPKAEKIESKATDLGSSHILAEQLGDDEFRKDYGLKYAYVAGAMYRGIASESLVSTMINAGFMAYFGAGGYSCEELKKKIESVKAQLTDPKKAGFNLLCNLEDADKEMQTVALYISSGIERVEAAAYLQMTEALVYFRVSGLVKDEVGQDVYCRHKILAKVSRPEVAEVFMQPAPSALVQKLLDKGLISPQQAELAKYVPMAHDVCVEADSGGHTDGGNPAVLFPAILTLKNRIEKEFGYRKNIRVGLAGGIGSPESATSAFVMGASFILTGSINQCTVEAGTSNAAKDLLQNMNIQDTAYAPAADMFEIGAKVQVLKKGVFFPARANKLFSLYQHYASLEDIPVDMLDQLQERYFGRKIADIWLERKRYLEDSGRHEAVLDAENRPKIKMASVFKWYFYNGTNRALEGDQASKVNFQIQTGPALGCFNQWVKGTDLEPWRNRHVDIIALKIMTHTAKTLSSTFDRYLSRA